ncbi:MAG: tetratricopeptide repeat protein [Bacteroidota bacterium]|jgi:tetratricopeptide (TPR) repeat protein
MKQDIVERKSWWKRLWDLIVDLALTLPPLAQWRHQTAKKNRQLGINKYTEGNISLAITYLKKAINQDPRNSDYYCNLGQIYFETDHYVDAELQFKKALKYNYYNLQAQKGLGYTLHAGYKYAEAIYVYLRYLQQDNQDADVLFNLGIALHNTGKYEEALHYYGRAEKLDPKNPAIPENRGLALFSLGKIDEAIGSLRQALELNSNTPGGYHFLGMCLEAKGEKEQALESYARALEQEPENGRAHLDASILLGRMGSYKEALEHGHMAIRFLGEKGDKDGLASAYWNVGWSYYQLGDWENSIRSSLSALQLIPNLFAARFNLALALLHQGRQNESIEEYRRGMEDVSLASDLKYFALDDLREALKKHPDLAGVSEILEMLETKYEVLKEKRPTSSMPA